MNQPKCKEVDIDCMKCDTNYKKDCNFWKKFKQTMEEKK